MRVSRSPIAMSGVTAFAVLLAAGAVLTAGAATTEAPQVDRTQGAQPITRTLITGERVFVSRSGGHPVVTIDPESVAPDPTARGTSGVRLRTRTVGEHAYVVPPIAQPLIGRQLDLSLFEVTSPPSLVEITPSGQTAQPVPGLTTTGSAGKTLTARIDSPSAFARALAAPDPLPGIASIRAVPASPPPATANPQYPMATLKIQGLDRNGAAAVSGSVTVDNVDDLQRFAAMQSFAGTGEVLFSVPVGHYSIAAEVSTIGTDGTISAQSVLALPELEVKAPATTVVADARTATARVTIPKTPRAAALEQVTSTFGRTSANGLQASVSFLLTGSQPVIYMTPTDPVTLGGVHWYNYYRLNGPQSGAGDSSDNYLYDLQFSYDRVPDTAELTVAEAQLAVIDSPYHSDVPDHRIGTYRSSIESWETVPMRFISNATAPSRRTEYVLSGAQVRWASGVMWNPTENIGLDLGPWSLLPAGANRTETHLAAPLAPGVDASETGTVPCSACRQADTLALNLSPWSSRGGRVISGLTSSSTLTLASKAKVYAGDNLVLETTEPVGTAKLPSADTPVRLELDTTKSGSWTTTSVQVKTVWQWRSQARAGTVPKERTCLDNSRNCAFEPLLFLSYDAGVSRNNTIVAGTATTIRIVADHQLFDTAAPASALTFEVSQDDGKTWEPVEVAARGSGQFTASVCPEAGSGYLSFRVNASDPAGSTIAQTITRAVKVAG